MPSFFFIDLLLERPKKLKPLPTTSFSSNLQATSSASLLSRTFISVSPLLYYEFSFAPLTLLLAFFVSSFSFHFNPYRRAFLVNGED